MRVIALIILAACLCMHAVAVTETAPASSQEEWGLVTVGCASLRGAPAHSAELETQATLGTPVKLLDGAEGEWRMVEMPDGYKAWMHTSAFVERDSVSMSRWRNASRLIVTNLYGTVALTDSTVSLPASALTDLTLGAILEGEACRGTHYASVRLPDGRSGFVPTSDIGSFDSVSVSPGGVSRILDAAVSMNGVSYLWGGTTPKAVDCSGFTQICYRYAGLLLPRNASQQAKMGQQLPIDDYTVWQPGDLLFFGDGVNNTRITHVGLYMGNKMIIHASGRVAVNSLDPASPNYIGRIVIAASRVYRWATPLNIHPWYFGN